MSHTGNEEKLKYYEKMSHYSEIAKKLIEDKLYLTALELYTELLENGREIKELKEFFSNPGNFEQQVHEYPTKLCKQIYLHYTFKLFNYLQHDLEVKLPWIV